MAESLAHLRNASSSELVSEAYWLKEILPVSFREALEKMLISGDLTWKRIRSSIIISCTRPFEGIVSAYSEAATNSHSNIQNFELMEAFLETFESIESEYGKFELSLEENEDPFSSNEIGMPNLSSEIETRWSKWDNHVKAFLKAMLRNGSACIEKSKHGVGFRFKNSFMKLASERWEKGTTLFRFCASISETFLKRIEKGFYIPKSEAKRVLFEEWGILGNNDFRFLSSPQDDKDLEAPDGRVTFPIRFKQFLADLDTNGVNYRMGKNEFGNLIFQLPAPVPTLAKKYMATKEEAITLYKAFKRGHWFTRVSDQVFELRREKVEFFEDIMKLAKEYIPISPLRNNKRSHQDSVLNESDDEREQKVLKVSTYDHSMKLKVSFPNQLGELLSILRENCEFYKVEKSESGLLILRFGEVFTELCKRYKDNARSFLLNFRQYWFQRISDTSEQIFTTPKKQNAKSFILRESKLKYMEEILQSLPREDQLMFLHSSTETEMKDESSDSNIWL